MHEMVDRKGNEVNGAKMKVGNRTYQEYLESTHWKVFRRIVLAFWDQHCSVCGSLQTSAALHIHHNSYDRIGEERLSDVVVLCPACHKLFHDAEKK